MSDASFSRLQLLKNLGFNPGTILDIGAYQGEWTRMAHHIWPKSKFFMVEANEDQRNALARIDGSGFEIALLGDKARKNAKYYATKHPVATGNSIYKEQARFFDDYEVRNLPMVTLDLLVGRRKFRNIDLIKIDTQGSELDIIAGGQKTVALAEFVLLETQNLKYNAGAPDTSEVITTMKKLGFHLFDITEIHYLPSGEMFQIDIVFAKNSSKFIKRGKLI